jgi:hypothetical protein
VKPLFLLRLSLVFFAAGLLLAALAYDWLGNAAHEIIGTGMFALLISHNILNRRWYGAITKGWREPSGIIAKTINLLLLIVMLILLVTSVIISQRSSASCLSTARSPCARSTHWRLTWHS